MMQSAHLALRKIMLMQVNWTGSAPQPSSTATTALMLIKTWLRWTSSMINQVSVRVRVNKFWIMSTLRWLWQIWTTIKRKVRSYSKVSSLPVFHRGKEQELLETQQLLVPKRFQLSKSQLEWTVVEQVAHLIKTYRCSRSQIWQKSMQRISAWMRVVDLMSQHVRWPAESVYQSTSLAIN